jgi:dipeptidyl-peptidase-4
MKIRKLILLLIFLAGMYTVKGQYHYLKFTPDETGVYKISDEGIVIQDLRTGKTTTFVSASKLIPEGEKEALQIEDFEFNAARTKLLLFTNAQRVWRYKTRGDYWIYDFASSSLKRVGKTLKSGNLKFAKFSPDGNKVAFVYLNNIYVEDVASGILKQLTTTGTDKLINGTFDWAYEEEFFCRDGFRWSPDSKYIAYWQVDAGQIRDYFMLRTTDSAYSSVIPVEYPKAGYSPSPVKIGVVSIANSVTRWMQFEGDPSQHYIVRMEWSAADELIVQRMDRKQQESKLIYCNAFNGSTRTFFAEYDEAWVGLHTEDPRGWTWVNNGKDFLWISEKDEWKNIYKISRDGKQVTLLTPGEYDIESLVQIDDANGYVYFTASPDNPVQSYLYRVKINTVSNTPEKIKGQDLPGIHSYKISPKATVALHSFSSHRNMPVSEWVRLPEGAPLNKTSAISVNKEEDNNADIEYIRIVTVDNILLDAWINKPLDFDSTKKYPVVFYVYGEPWASTVADGYGYHNNFLYNGDMRKDGYIQVAVDNRGSPSLKGAAWRKSVYKNLGQVNIRDMAMAAFQILQLPYMDKDRVAVWGWSGGGTSTLHLMFRYPDLFKTGIAIAPSARLDFYDNIYTERYMGLPQENPEIYERNSSVTYVKGLKGNLMLIHGTLDDNVHYSNTELLINELIKHQKDFEVMPYPNRSHSLQEGEGSFEHLSRTYTRFLQRNCPPGARSR